MIIAELVGWTGALGLLFAYALLSEGKVAASSRIYVVLNLAGAGGLALNGAAHAAWPSVALNLVWLAIGARAVQLHRRQAAASSHPD